MTAREETRIFVAVARAKSAELLIHSFISSSYYWALLH
jgi:hypothetical protein